METRALESSDEPNNDTDIVWRSEQIMDEMLIYDFDGNEGDSKHGPMSIREVLTL